MLLDQYGKEIKAQKPILTEVTVQAVRDRYSTYPSNGLTPQRLANIFREADIGNIARQAELFEEMEEKDLHLGGVLQTRKLAIAGLDWEILPASAAEEDKKIAGAAREMFEYIENFEDALLDMLDAIGKGFATQEIIWDLSEGQVWAQEFSWVHQSHFTFSKPDGRLSPNPKLLTNEAPLWGEELLPNKFIVHKYRARSGATQRGGLLRPCAYMYLFKNYDLKDWVIFNELFSVPMRIGKYKPGATKEEKETLKRAVFNLGVDAAAVISDNSIIELLESKLRGDAGTFTALAEFCDKAMSKGVLGHTGSAESTAGRLGGENASEAVRQDLVASDAKALMKTIKFQIVAPWVLFNYGPHKGVPIFKLHFKADEDIEKAARVYGVLVKDANFTGIPESHIHERFGIPVPAKGEPTLRAAQTMPLALGMHNKRNEKNETMVNSASVWDADAWIKFYLGRLEPALSGARQEALDEIEKWLRSLGEMPAEEELIEGIERILGDRAAHAVSRQALTNTVAEIYTSVRLVPGVTLGFGGADVRAINFLGGLDHFYISSYFKNPDAQSVMRNFIREHYLEKGGGLFGRGNPAAIAEFRNLMGQKAAELEDWQIRRIVDTSVQRTRNWASIAQMHEAGITELEVYEPTQDCAFCQSMNGKIIGVETAFAVTDRQARMNPEEYEADLRAANQEMTRMAQAGSQADYAADAGMVPPYHPHCRGMVIKRVR